MSLKQLNLLEESIGVAGESEICKKRRQIMANDRPNYALFSEFRLIEHLLNKHYSGIIVSHYVHNKHTKKNHYIIQYARRSENLSKKKNYRIIVFRFVKKK